MHALKRNSSGYRAFMAIVLVLTLFAVASSGAAQDTPSNSQPAGPGGLPPDAPPVVEPTLETLAFPRTENYYDICQSIAGFTTGQAVSDDARPRKVGEIVVSQHLSNNRIEVAADLIMPPGALVTMYGPEAWFQVTEGGVAVVSCGGDMIFDLRSGDNAQYVLPAGTALVVTPDQREGVFLALDQMTDRVWIIQIGHGTASTIDLHLEVGESPDLICDQVGCWDTADVVVPPPDTNNDGEADGGGPCALVRCWGK